MPPITIYTQLSAPIATPPRSCCREEGRRSRRSRRRRPRGAGRWRDAPAAARPCRRSSSASAMSAAATISTSSTARATRPAAGGLSRFCEVRRNDQVRPRLRQRPRIRKLVPQRRRLRTQAKRGFVDCPACGSTSPSRSWRPPSSAAARRRRRELAPPRPVEDAAPQPGRDRRRSAGPCARWCASCARRSPPATTSAPASPTRRAG